MYICDYTSWSDSYENEMLGKTLTSETTLSFYFITCAKVYVVIKKACVNIK
jgi:hypothetical protein